MGICEDGESDEDCGDDDPSWWIRFFFECGGWEKGLTV